MTVNFPTTVDELRTALLEAGDDPATVAAMKKADLKNRLLEITNNNLELQLEAINEEEDPKTLEKAIGIEYGSKAWNDYVLGMLDESEQIDGYPKVVGLARLVNILGDVVVSRANQVIVTHGEMRSVTVNYELHIEWKLNTPVGYGNLNFTPQVRVFGGVADCNENLDNTYMRHAAATAETKAFGRALRKALGITTIAAEEMLSGASEEMPKAKASAPISTPLQSVIKAKVAALGLTLDKVLNDWEDGGGVSTLEDLTMEDGRELFAFINTYQQNK